MNANQILARNEAGLALGRILRLASRPSRPGDVAEYERCRAIIMEAVGSGVAGAWTPNVARDRNRGAAGQWGGQ